jgi:hypothetical protein
MWCILSARFGDKKRIAAVQSAVIIATAFLVAQARPDWLAAQSLSSLRIGDPPSKLSSLGPMSDSGSYKGMELRKWVLPSGNELSVTIGSNGLIVYLESDWDGKNDDPACDLTHLHFGSTTLSELRKRFGKNGFGFEDRPPAIETADGAVMINSWEVGTVVVTFYTRIGQQDYDRMKASGANPPPADYAKLDAISIAGADYAKSEWGDRIYDPQ